MLADERRKKLAALVSRRGFISLAELATEFAASESTIRRDLEALDHSGLIRRTHGGAMAATDAVSVPAFEDRSRVCTSEKRSIGAVAAQLVAEGETVLLDGGTTTFEVARHLRGRLVQVITNSLPIASMLASDRNVDVTMVGGYVYPRTGVAVGQLAVQFLGSVQARRLIMSVAGATDRGFFNSNSLLVETQLRMMQVVDEIIVVADHTKFGQKSLAFLCELGRVHRLVTDAGLTDEFRRKVHEAGPTVIIATGEPE